MTVEQEKTAAETKAATDSPEQSKDTSEQSKDTSEQSKDTSEQSKDTSGEKPKDEASEKKDVKSLLDSDEGEDEESSDSEEKGEGEDEDEENDDPVPEKYEFETPEGTELDEGMIESFKPLAKELGLGQKGAQKLVDLVANKTQEAMESQRKQEAEMISGWQKEITSDPDHKDMITSAKLTINKFGKDNPEFNKLTKSWLGSHPGFVKFLASIGTHLKEADMDSGSAGSNSGDGSLGSILYPNMSKNK